MSIVATPDGPLNVIDEAPAGRAFIFPRPLPAGTVVEVYDKTFDYEDGPAYQIEVLWCGVPRDYGGVFIYRLVGGDVAYRCPVLYYNPDSMRAHGRT